MAASASNVVRMAHTRPLCSTANAEAPLARSAAVAALVKDALQRERKRQSEPQVIFDASFADRVARRQHLTLVK